MKFLIFQLLSLSLVSHLIAAGEPVAATPNDNPDLVRMYAEDQTDRTPTPDGKMGDWSKIADRDEVRELKVKSLYEAGQLKTGADYYHAAMILQHAETPDDYLLCHDLCVVAISKGYLGARWLAAASEDRFLMALWRPQRFGTQYRQLKPNAPMALYSVDPKVTDGLRADFGVPTLEEAKKREAMMQGVKP